jgi:hypothetical protein
MLIRAAIAEAAMSAGTRNQHPSSSPAKPATAKGHNIPFLSWRCWQPPKAQADALTTAEYAFSTIAAKPYDR